MANKKGYNKNQAQAKVNTVMSEFKDKTLHSGRGGKVVTNRRQAVAIAMSESGQAKKKKQKTSVKLSRATKRTLKSSPRPKKKKETLLQSAKKLIVDPIKKNIERGYGDILKHPFRRGVK